MNYDADVYADADDDVEPFQKAGAGLLVATALLSTAAGQVPVSHRLIMAGLIGNRQIRTHCFNDFWVLREGKFLWPHFSFSTKNKSRTHLFGDPCSCY